MHFENSVENNVQVENSVENNKNEIWKLMKIYFQMFFHRSNIKHQCIVLISFKLENDCYYI